MFAGCARWDGQELVKGENAGFAAFPACITVQLTLAPVITMRFSGTWIDYTLLTLVKDWWPWMIDTILLRVSKDLSAAFVNALARHRED